MRVLITGADQPLGVLAAGALKGEHELRLTGMAAPAPAGLGGLPYTPADPREPEQAAPLMEGVEAVLHLAPHALPAGATEEELLDISARGMYVLQRAALAAGVRRVVLASRLELMAAYTESALVDETWKPMPSAEAASLAPYLAEITLREFVRAEEIVGICLRFGELGTGAAGTTPEDAVSAIRKALAMDLTGRRYRWWLYQIGSTDRWPLGHAAGRPLSFERRGA